MRSRAVLVLAFVLSMGVNNTPVLVLLIPRLRRLITDRA